MVCRIFLKMFVIVVSSLSILGGVYSIYGQAIVEGRITDALTQEPLQAAHVFFSGTKIGTSTDSTGYYKLRQVPSGAHRLVVSIIGYGRKTSDIVLHPEETKNLDFALYPVVYELEEILVGNLDKKWKRRLERFENLFLGETQWADSVRIMNPEVLRFDTNFWGRLTAEALAPLRIENQALGYHIIYYLEEFKDTGTRTRWDGEPLFSEMTSTDSLQQARWEENRRKAFYGSIRHFLLSLLNDRLEEEGFALYNVREKISGFRPERRYHISPEKVIDEIEEDFLFEMKFFDRLEIIYRKEKEDRRYVRWARHLNRRPAELQTSWLELNERPITLDIDGEIVEPYGATQMGYFAFERLANLTPREYRPENYIELDQEP